jgi:cytochrome c553
MSKPMYVPDYSHSGMPLPAGILAWDGQSKTTDVSDDDDFAHFQFTFTNISPGDVVLLSVHPSCGCTTADVHQMPWMIPAGSNGTFSAKINLNVAGHSGMIFKRITVATDKGSQDLALRVNIHPAVMRPLSSNERQMGRNMAKMDRQAVFHGDCASCHAKRVNGKYGQALYDTVCGICHEGPDRASFVPDLTRIKSQTNLEFWRTWITYGKPGSLMPAFATAQGGPLTDMQIASLAAYLNTVHPSRVPAP